ncbi:MAG: hypothetical protein QG622_783 [Actinomycetota bacterium]|nr:hypothetical protein [Actinomycetota bacterium]
MVLNVEPRLRVFPAEPRSIPEARTWAGRQLTDIGVPSETVERAELLVSELTGNVVRHTTSDQFVVRLDIQDGVEVGVHDEDPVARPESRREPQLLDLSGRGMLVIANVADAWAVEPTSTGKWVRVLIDEPVPRG